jgi:ubiquinone/menaquinone biosynthesis C-methylase UbiE
MSLIPEEIEAHYRQTKESERLAANARGELERLRTEAILARRLPPAPAIIYDVGGAAGIYAFPLAKQGYEVHLIDPVELHLEEAKTCALTSSVTLKSITQGDARRLDITSGTADAVLLLGPLYHLVDQSDRVQALCEAHRVLKLGGVLFAAAISRFASLIDGLASGFFKDSEFRKIIAADLASGQHRNPTGNPFYFTTTYFHRPEDLAEEVCSVGFNHVETLAIEGPAWSAAGFADVWTEPIQRQNLMEFLSVTEQQPSPIVLPEKRPSR